VEIVPAFVAGRLKAVESAGQSTGQTVYVVDHDRQSAESVRRLMESLGLRTEIYSDAGGFLRVLDPKRPGCLIVDADIPGMGGLGLQDRLARESNRLPVIMMSADGHVETVVQAMKAGAVDFLRKPCAPQVLLDCVRRALELDAGIREVDAERARVAARMALLTPREREVMDLLVEGMSTKQIAMRLGLSRKTVDAYRSHVRIKLVAESLVDLVHMAELHVSGNKVAGERLVSR
jgi:FixJ family two-component response regulator